MTKVNISIPNEILDEIDRLGEEENMTRSELLRTAFKAYKELLLEKKGENNKRESIEKAILIQDEIRSVIGEIDLIQELRKWRDERI